MKRFFGVVAAGAMFVNWLIMAAFVFAEFGGWGFLALGMTPLITGALGPPVMWLAYSVPVISLWIWGGMVGAWVLWLVVPEGNKLGGRSTVTSPVLGDLRTSYEDVPPQSPVTRLATIIGDAKDTQETIERLRAALHENNQNPEVWFALSQCHGERGDLRRAYDTAQVAIGLNPSDARFHFAVATILVSACVDSMLEGESSVGGTLEELGLELDRAKFKAEFHANEAIRLSATMAMENRAKQSLRELKNAEKQFRRRRK